MMKNPHWLVGEALGVFIITFVGCGAIMVDVLSAGVIGHVGVSLAFGLSYGVAILTLGEVSRGHFNPFFSIGFAVFGKMPVGEAAAAIAAQVVGAFVAVALLSVILGDVAALGTSFPVTDVALVADSDPVVIAAAIETVISAILMFVAMSVSRDGRLAGNMAAATLGMTVVMLTLVAGPLNGAPMNPARSLAPAILSGAVGNLWVYLVMPVLGGLIGGGLRVLVEKLTPHP